MTVQANITDLLCAQPLGDLDTSKLTLTPPADPHQGLFPRPASSLDMTQDVRVQLSDVFSFAQLAGEWGSPLFSHPHPTCFRART